MLSQSKLKTSRTSVKKILSEINASTELYLASPPLHNLEGVKALVDRRRKLIAQLEKIHFGAINKLLEKENIDLLLSRFQELDLALELSIRQLQAEIISSINFMKRMKKTFSGYKSPHQKKALFIDKKR